MPLVGKKGNLLLVILALTIISFMFSIRPASATYTSDNQNSSYYYYQGGDARYWHYSTCSLCVNGGYVYTGNTQNTAGNYAYWYYRGSYAGHNIDANIPNASGANTTKAMYFLYTFSDSLVSENGVTVNQKAIGGWTRVYTSFGNGDGGYMSLSDRTGEASSTTNIGFDAIRWN